MTLSNEKDSYREHLVKWDYPGNLVSVEIAWAAQQPRGVATLIVDSVNTIREFLDERRNAAQ